MEIIEKTAESAWKKALKYIMNSGSSFIDRDSRVCRETLNLIITVKDVSSISRLIDIFNSFDKWVYPPIEELEAIALTKKEIPGYYYNYGARAFNFNGINQVDNYVIPLLKKDSTSRRASVVFYSPEKDSSLFKKDIPGVIMMNFNIRGKKLHVSTLVRSNDIFFGWPANLYQTLALQKHIARELNVDPGEITTISISGHIFEDQFEDIRRIV